MVSAGGRAVVSAKKMFEMSLKTDKDFLTQRYVVNSTEFVVGTVFTEELSQHNECVDLPV